MKKFNQTKKGDTIVIEGDKYTVASAGQDGRGFKIITEIKYGKQKVMYNENPNATI